MKEVKSNKHIPLTEDLLIKLGFNSKYKSVHTYWNIGSFGLDQKSDEDGEGNSIEQEDVFYYDNVEVKHLHQLQKLYLKAENKELAIN